VGAKMAKNVNSLPSKSSVTVGAGFIARRRLWENARLFPVVFGIRMKYAEKSIVARSSGFLKLSSNY